MTLWKAFCWRQSYTVYPTMHLFGVQRTSSRFFFHSQFAFCYFAKNVSITLLYCVWTFICWWISTSYPVCETKDFSREYRMNEIAPSIKAASLFPVFSPRVMGVAVARYDFASRDTQELSLLQGDVIRVYSKLPNGWWKGEVDGRVGLPLHLLHRSVFPLMLWWSPLADKAQNMLNDFLLISCNSFNLFNRMANKEFEVSCVMSCLHVAKWNPILLLLRWAGSPPPMWKRRTEFAQRTASAQRPFKADSLQWPQLFSASCKLVHLIKPQKLWLKRKWQCPPNPAVWRTQSRCQLTCYQSVTLFLVCPSGRTRKCSAQKSPLPQLSLCLLFH